MTLLHVPVIDLTPYRKGTPEGKAAVAEQVGEACRDIGFLVVSGHGISEDLIRETYDVSKEFFDLPFGEKVKADRPAPDQVRGYSAVGGEGLSYSLDEPTPPDLKESLSIGPVNVPAGDSYFTCEAAGPHFADNVWPARPADLKSIWTDYFQAVDSLATDLMRLFALALKLDESYFDKTIDKNISMMRVLRYPKQATPPLLGQLRAGAHSDYGSMTILRKELSDGGLQVKNKAGEGQRAGHRGFVDRQHRRSDAAMDERFVDLDGASRRQSAAGLGRKQGSALDRVLPSTELRCDGRMPAELPVVRPAG
jgi:isopenicillin N synthase-like dioxygenase